MNSFMDYIKGGEFLIAPSLNYKDQYILKCFECDEYYDELESLLSHCIGHQNKNIGEECSLDGSGNDSNKSDDIKTTSFKFENNTETEGEDPLTSIEWDCAADTVSLIVKEEPKFRCYQMDEMEHDAYEPEEELTDVPDDTNSEIIETNAVTVSLIVKEEPKSGCYQMDEIERDAYEPEEEFTDVPDDTNSENIERDADAVSLIVKEEPKSGCYQMDEIECDAYEPEELTDVSDDTNSEIIETNAVTKKCIKSGSFVRDFMKSKINVTTLIAAYKKQPKLWNSNIPNIRTQERNGILHEISKELKSQVNVDFSYAQVTAVIAHMRYTYRVKTKRMQTTDQCVAPTWYLEQLSFLKPFLEKIQPDLPRKQFTQILDIYKRHPNLWNTDLAENCCENKRIEAYEDMIKDIESEMSMKINQNTLKEYIESIHNCVAKSKHRDMMNNQTETFEASEYYPHIKFLYNYVGPFKCSECGRKLRTALAFKVHKSQHDGSMPLICSLCNKEFKRILTYTYHARRHMEDLKIGCKECGRRFLKSYDLKIHMRCHTGAKPFCCEICGTSFRHIQTFTAHMRKHEKKYTHICPICSKGFYTKAKHDDHVRSHKNIREFECKTCGKAFKTKKTLLQHEPIHDDARNHACSLCGKTFKLKGGLIQHMKTHGSNVEKNITMD